jgi:hypothetical protein
MGIMPETGVRNELVKVITSLYLFYHYSLTAGDSIETFKIR